MLRSKDIMMMMGAKCDLNQAWTGAVDLLCSIERLPHASQAISILPELPHNSTHPHNAVACRAPTVCRSPTYLSSFPSLFILRNRQRPLLRWFLLGFFRYLVCLPACLAPSRSPRSYLVLPSSLSRCHRRSPLVTTDTADRVLLSYYASSGAEAQYY